MANGISDLAAALLQAHQAAPTRNAYHIEAVRNMLGATPFLEVDAAYEELVGEDLVVMAGNLVVFEGGVSRSLFKLTEPGLTAVPGGIVAPQVAAEQEGEEDDGSADASN